MSKTLGKVTTIALVLHLELDEIAHANAAVSADAMGEDFATIEQLVQMGAAHAKAPGGLARRDRLVAIDDDDFVACTYAAA